MHTTFIRSAVVGAALLAALPAFPVVAQSVAVDADIPMQQASDRGTIRAVTLYPDRAAVTRSVRVDLRQGLWTLRVPELPRSVVPNSLQAKVGAAEGSAPKSAPKLLGVDFAATPKVDFASSPEGVALAEKVRTLKRRIAELQQDRALLEQHDKLVDQVGVRPSAGAGADGATQPIDLAAAEKLLAAVHAEKERILKVSREQNDSRERMERELAVAEQQLAARGGADRTDRAGLVLLSVPESCSVEVQFTYLVSNAGWAPAYSVRGNGDRSGVSVEYDAMVVQRTGEDWNEVRLSLSTAQPSTASSPPPVDPWFVDVVLPPPPAEARMQAMSTGAPAPVAMADMAPGSPTGDPGAAGNSAEMAKAIEEFAASAAVNEAGTAVSFELPRPVTLPSDSVRQQRTRIGSFEPETRFTYVAAPILTESVFLRGDMRNSSAFQLLPGKAQVFMGGDFVGETAMPSVAPKDEFRVYFGPDRALRAKREVLSKVTGSSGLFGGSTVTTWNDRITLDNGTGRDVRVEVYDRRPVSRNEKIEARATNLSPALSADKPYVEGRMPQGILRWDLAVPAAARGPKAATVTWTVEVIRPNGLETTPLPD